MTRENKLSIVIAFGLLIFVGMLVADHYSIASGREVADLGSNAPTPPKWVSAPLVDGPAQDIEGKLVFQSTGDQIHTIRQGETLRSICGAWYGDSGLASAVANWNKISNPNNLKNGETIALPSRDSLVAAALLSRPLSPAIDSSIEQSSSSFEEYTVKSGDTLSELAYKLMGTSKKTVELFNLNRNVMPDPDTIYPGMILQYPNTSN
ncbi:MAG: LysM peptidoglycan-binding domain-containing protein [Planctomycetota bacterium]|nr:LysM peptidoglycan-binding domain-containing protein [Planctomycetota bacterium]